MEEEEEGGGRKKERARFCGLVALCFLMQASGIGILPPVKSIPRAPRLPLALELEQPNLCLHTSPSSSLALSMHPRHAARSHTRQTR